MKKEQEQLGTDLLNDLGIKEDLHSYIGKILLKEQLSAIEKFKTGDTGNIVLLTQTPDG